MISIVVSSYKENNFIAFEANVAQTIGVPYEIIRMHNPALMSIGAAYNSGAEKAQYGFIGFLHEDIVFHTQDWGKLLIALLSQQTTGLVGVAGGTYKSKNISSAWHNGELFINLLQHKEGSCFHWKSPQNFTGHTAEVLVLDGVFLGIRKEIWQATKFDQITLQGFHFYDMDISLSVKLLGLKNYVTYDILLEHYSFGNNDKSWYDEAVNIHKKWLPRLPWSLHEYDITKRREFEYAAIVHNMSVLFGGKQPVPFGQKAAALLKFWLAKPLAKPTYKYIVKLLFKS